MKLKFTILFSLFFALAGKAQVCSVFISHVISGNQVQYFATSPDNPATWSWFFNGGTPLTASIQNPVITYNNLGTFICACTVTGGPNGCSASLSAGQDTVTISSSGIPEIKKINEVLVFSRNAVPAFEINSNSSQTVSIELYDITGGLIDVVFKGVLNSGINLFQMRPVTLPIGNYVLHVNTEQGKIIRKFHWEN